jgi:nitric oxide reductase activation protein
LIYLYTFFLSSCIHSLLFDIYLIPYLFFPLDDIDSLFSKPEFDQYKSKENENEENKIEEEEEEEEDGEDNYDTGSQDTMNAETVSEIMKVDFSPRSISQEEIPKWLIDADKAAKQSRKIKKKTKKLTDDWRFWAAIIGSVGLLSAAYSVYSQTGFDGGSGSIPNVQELII